MEQQNGSPFDLAQLLTPLKKSHQSQGLHVLTHPGEAA
jgi:hypothetical protein